MTFDPLLFKQQFPLFSEPENHDLVYLDNAATTQKPQCVIDAITHFYTHNNGNAQRASHRLARNATDIILRVREQTKTFLGATKAEEIVFTQGATASVNMIAYGLRSHLKADDCIAVSLGEHHGNLLPWQEASQATGCTLSLVSPSFDELINGSIADKQSLKIIALTIASNALGNITSTKILDAIRQQYPDSIMVLDITQWCAHYPIDLKTIPCDFAVCSAHKFYGPTGLGILYGKQSLLEKLDPHTVGGEMVDRVSPQKSRYHRGYKGLEAGTSSMAAIAALGACLNFWKEQDRHAMEKHEKALSVVCHQKLDVLFTSHPSIMLLTQAKNNIGIITIGCRAPYSITDLALWLDERNIATRAGEHCTQLLWKNHKANISGGTLRLSIAAYNTQDDIDRAITAIREYCQFIDNSSKKINTHTTETIELDDLHKHKSWQQRYKQIVLWGKSMPPQTDIRQDDYLLKGCESLVWLQHQQVDNKHYFTIDSDSNVIKGLAAIILCQVNGKTHEAIHKIDFEQCFHSLGLQKHLSDSRMNGFYNIYKTICNTLNMP